MSETTVNSGDGRIRFYTDPESGKITFVQGDNVRVFDMPQARGSDGASLGGGEGEPKHVSAARQKLERIRARAKKPVCEKVTLGKGDEAEEWFIRSISLPELREIAFLCSRDERGAIQIETADEYTGFMAAVFAKCLASDECGTMPLFEANEAGWGECYAMAADRNLEVVQTNGQLLTACLLQNPQILPEANAEFDAILKAAKEADDFLAQALASSTPNNGSPESGASEIQPT